MSLAARAGAGGLVLAGLSGRRLQLFARARMGGRGGAGARRRRAARPGSPTSSRSAPAAATRSCWRGRWRPTTRRRSPSSPRRWRPRPSGCSRRRRRARPSRGRPPRPGACAVPAMPYPVAVGHAARLLGLPARGDRDAVRAGLRRQRRLGRGAADPGRPDRGPADHRGAAAARRRASPRRRSTAPLEAIGGSRRRAPTSPRCCTRPSIRGSTAREPRARRRDGDPMTSHRRTVRCASASAGRSAPARPR